MVSVCSFAALLRLAVVGIVLGLVCGGSEAAITSYNATLTVSKGSSCDVRVVEDIEYVFSTSTGTVKWYPGAAPVGATATPLSDGERAELTEVDGAAAPTFDVTFTPTTRKRLRFQYTSAGPLSATLSENKLAWMAVSRAWPEMISNVQTTVIVQSLSSLTDVTASPPGLDLQVVAAGLEAKYSLGVLAMETGVSISMEFPVVAKCKAIPVWVYIVIAIAATLTICGIVFCIWRFCCRRPSDGFISSSSASSASSNSSDGGAAQAMMGGPTASAAEAGKVGGGPVIQNNGGALMSYEASDGKSFAGNGQQANGTGQPQLMHQSSMGDMYSNADPYLSVGPPPAVGYDVGGGGVEMASLGPGQPTFDNPDTQVDDMINEIFEA
ncbi:uncharacterized protein AMSG_05604 [Thecamonas trahens ATCC 50062]|uniref:Transmembrane protein n=1 Tax=Thecamonas trahens ATCC 50062 TaxID=461836 RepID=A0A0L0DE36_THETB|nr:hypothetical protein AMSG_05604 [Thecamonas trahens ATCC 50062]KNC49568.1 hypothetical protein AMSG_05604 [Thecamonas trahens ATCC 50062]|eukprot:XP_013757677.1 hypothetical protein AMSG_05604 [Thecamonas trahens ATCC 50062]